MILVDRLGVFFFNQISDLIGGSLILPWDTLYNPFPIVFVERIIGGIPAPVPTYTTLCDSTGYTYDMNVYLGKHKGWHNTWQQPTLQWLISQGV